MPIDVHTIFLGLHSHMYIIFRIKHDGKLYERSCYVSVQANYIAGVHRNALATLQNGLILSHYSNISAWSLGYTIVWCRDRKILYHVPFNPLWTKFFFSSFFGT